MSAGYFFFKSSLQATQADTPNFVYSKVALKTTYPHPSREGNYPIYLNISNEKVCFYCASHHRQTLEQQSYPAYYGTGIIGAFTFHLGHTESIERWLNQTGAIDPAILDNAFYKNTGKTEEESNPNFFSCFKNAFLGAVNGVENALSEYDVILYKEIALDFLFDLFHSNVFNDAPAAQLLKESLLGSRLIKCILAKADFLYYDKLLELGKVGNLENSFFKQKKENAAIHWLDQIRAEGASNIINPLKYTKESWFENIEKEHESVYNNINALPKEEHEKSCEWLVGRYMINDSFMHLVRSYSIGNKILLVLMLIGGVSLFLGWFIDYIRLTGNFYFDRIIYCICCATLLIPALVLTERVVSLFLMTIMTFVNRLVPDQFKPATEDLSDCPKKTPMYIGPKYNWTAAIKSKLKIKWFDFPAEVLVSIPFIVQILMPKGLVAGAIVLFSLREYLTEEDHAKAKFISNILQNNYLNNILWVTLIMSCGAFITTKLLPMLQKNPKKERTLCPIIKRSFPLLLFLFSFCFVIVLFLNLAPITGEKQPTLHFVAYIKEIISAKADFALASVLAMIGATAGILVEFSTSKTIRSAVGME